MVRKLCVTSVLFMLLVGSSALAQVQYGSLDGLVGEVVFYYEWAPTEGPPWPRVSIGDGTVATGRESRTGMRLILGRDGVVVRREGEVTYYAPARATVIEMAPVDLSALDGLRAQAIWRYVGETGPETPSRLNFSYTVRAVTTRIRAAEVIVTPDYLVVVSSGGAVKIISRLVVEDMSLLSVSAAQSLASPRDLSQFESTRPFRGLQWGDPPAVLGAVQAVRRGTSDGLSYVTYIRPWEDLNLGAGFKASSIEYLFLEDKLAAITIHISEEVDLDHAVPQLKEIAERYKESLVQEEWDTSRLDWARDSYVLDMHYVLRDMISEQWYGMRTGGLDQVMWRLGDQGAILTREGGLLSGQGHLVLVLYDASVL